LLNEREGNKLFSLSLVFFPTFFLSFSSIFDYSQKARRLAHSELKLKLIPNSERQPRPHLDFGMIALSSNLRNPTSNAMGLKLTWESCRSCRQFTDRPRLTIVSMQTTNEKERKTERERRSLQG